MAHTLCDHAQILVLSNYRPQISHEKYSEMQNKQRILEEADAYKRDILSQVCQKRGVLLLECDEAYTSCTCSVCGTIHESIPTKHRIWRCVQCNSVLDRDENAAQNLLKRVLSRMFLQSLIDKKYILPSSGHLYTTVNQWMQDPAMMLYIKSMVQRCSFVFNGGCKARRTKAVKSLLQGRIFTGKLRQNPPSLGHFVAASLSKKKP